MGTVPQQYFTFIMDYAPYFYVIPGTGVDTEWGRGPAAAAHAIDFLNEAYQSSQFESEKTAIYNKIVELANYLVSIQCTDDGKLAYGGFQSKDGSADYYSIDAMRAVPALLKAYTLTGTTSYLDAATLAGETFLYNMQHKPSELEVHDQYYGGFAQAVTITDEWLPEMHSVDLYGLIALKKLYDRTIGLGAKIVAETLPLAGKPYVETIAVMAKYNPFFEKAGMTKIAETMPNPKVLEVVEKLRAFNFNPVFLTSEKANLNKLQTMTETEVSKVRMVINQVTGIYRKRIAGTKQAFLNKEEYEAIVDAADNIKLAKMLRILGFLTQTKVYLFWKKQINCPLADKKINFEV